MQSPFNATYLRCDRCSGSLEEKQDFLFCRQCSKSISKKDRRYFFITPPSDAPESSQTSNPQSWSRWRRVNYLFFKKKLPADSARILLDIGAGPTQFKDLFFSFSYVGLDFFPYEHVTIVSDFTKKLPLQDACVDVVVLSNVIEHVPEPSVLLEEAFRVLRSGGSIIATTPFLFRIHQAPYDFQRLTYYGHEYLFKKVGFREITVEPLGEPLNVYRGITNNYFDAVYENVQNQNGSAVKVSGLLIRFLKKVHALTPFILHTLLPYPQPSIRYAEGYGVTASK